MNILIRTLRRGARLAFIAATLVGLAATGARAEPHASDWAGIKDQAQLRLVSAVSGTGNLDTLRLGLQFRIEKDWKIYWRSPGPTGYPPEIDWSGSENIGEAQFAWPAPKRFKIFGIEAIGYKEEVVFPLDIDVTNPGSPVTLRAKVTYLVCKEICIPGEENLTLGIPASGAEATPFAALIARYRARIPVAAEKIGVTMEQAVFRKTADDTVSLRVVIRSDRPLQEPDLFLEGPPAAFFESPQVTLSNDKQYAVITELGTGATAEEIIAQPMLATLVTHDLAAEQDIKPVLVDAFPPLPPDFAAASGSTKTGLWAILGLALIGGLILNLMPCVLPVLSLKLLSVLGHGGRENTDVRLGFLASVAGIMSSFMLLAAALAVLKAAGTSIGWGIQFQQPVFLAIMVVVVTLFACNLFGLFEITLPSWLNDVLALDTGPRHGHHHSLGGHFLTGAFATLLATPCSAPFLGTAVGFAFARGPAEIFMVFAALGLGLSVPYLLVAAFPGLATRMPRPGSWMVGMKRFLGLMLVATAVWLIVVIATEAGTDTAVGIGIAAALIGVVLWLRQLQGSRLGRHSGLIATLLAAAIIAAPLFVSAVANDGEKTLDDKVWQPFDQAKIARLVSDGKTVLVDVTADWCLTCQVNKAAVLNRGPVADLLESGAVVAMKADWTKPDQEIADYLASFGRYGIPFNAVYGPQVPTGLVLPELLVTDTVLNAVEKASGSSALAEK